MGSPSAHAFYHSDGNGNITSLIYSNQSIAAKYEYDPYGNILSEAGSLADVNSYRFSSKECHQASGLTYYLYRYYAPTLQKWPNRDPLGERGGLNLYGFCGNNGISNVDIDGRTFCDCLKAMARLAKANFRLNLLLTEAAINIKGTGLDANHLRNINDAMNSVNDAMRVVIQHCGGYAEAAALVAAAAALLTEVAAIVASVAAAPAGA